MILRHFSNELPKISPAKYLFVLRFRAARNPRFYWVCDEERFFSGNYLWKRCGKKSTFRA